MSSESYLLELLSKKPVEDVSKNTFIYQKTCPHVKYYKDRLSVKYIGRGELYTSITVNLNNQSLLTQFKQSVQANQPASKDRLIYYFEVKILDDGQRCDISIGFAHSDFPLNKHVGCTRKYMFNNFKQILILDLEDPSGIGVMGKYTRENQLQNC